jgi:hypothetical protein
VDEYDDDGAKHTKQAEKGETPLYRAPLGGMADMPTSILVLSTILHRINIVYKSGYAFAY